MGYLQGAVGGFGGGGGSDKAYCITAMMCGERTEEVH